MSAWIKNLFGKSWWESPKTFPTCLQFSDPLAAILDIWRFHRRIIIEWKNSFSERWSERPITYDLTPLPGGHFGFRHSRRWANAPGAARLVLFSFFFFSQSSMFFHGMATLIKRFIWKSWQKHPKIDPFPDPVSHFGAPWWPFWIFEVLMEGII